MLFVGICQTHRTVVLFTIAAEQTPSISMRHATRESVFSISIVIVLLIRPRYKQEVKTNRFFFFYFIYFYFSMLCPQANVYFVSGAAVTVYHIKN